jgi:hypothetical protein
MGEMRAQERKPCEHAPFGCVSQDDPHHCDGCNGDGTRWVTVGTLVESGQSCVDCGTASGWYGVRGDEWVDLYEIEETEADG